MPVGRAELRSAENLSVESFRICCAKKVLSEFRGQLPQLKHPRFCICPDVAVCSTISTITGIDPLPNPLLLFTAQIVAIMSVFLLGWLPQVTRRVQRAVFAVIHFRCFLSAERHEWRQH